MSRNFAPSTESEEHVGRRKRRDEDHREERAVEPDEASRHGNDPDAVRIDRNDERGSSGSESVDTSYGQRSGHVSRDERFDDDRDYETETRRRRVSNNRHQEHDSEGGGDYVARRDSARWGPIWAGLITTLTTFLLLQLLAIGIGIAGVGPSSAGGAWVSAIIGIIAFFVGGLVAGMTSSVRGAVPGLLNGFLVWALGTVLILALSALGVGQIFGALGNVVGQVGVLQNIQNGGVKAPNVNASQIASDVRTGAIGAFFGLLIAAVSAMIGGLAGGSPSEPVGHMARNEDR